MAQDPLTNSGPETVDSDWEVDEVLDTGMSDTQPVKSSWEPAEIEDENVDYSAGRLESGVGQFTRGVGDIVASVPQSVGEVSGFLQGTDPDETAGADVAEKVRGFFQGVQEINPNFANEWNQKLARGAGSMAGFMAGGVAGAAAKLPAWLGAAGLGATATGVEQVEDLKAIVGEDPDADERAKALGFGGLLGLSEAAPIARIFGRLDKVTGGGVKKVLSEGAKGSVEEAAQEVFQTLGQNLIASDVLKYDKERDQWEGTAEAGSIGGTLGFLFNSLAAGVGSRRMKRMADQQQPTEQPEQPAGDVEVQEWEVDEVIDMEGGAPDRVDTGLAADATQDEALEQASLAPDEDATMEGPAPQAAEVPEWDTSASPVVGRRAQPDEEVTMEGGVEGPSTAGLEVEEIDPEDITMRGGAPFPTRKAAELKAKTKALSDRVAVKTPDGWVLRKTERTRHVEGDVVPRSERIATPRNQTELDQAVTTAATHPESARPEPTENQKKAGNYFKPKVRIGEGLPVITVENPKGSVRRGKSADGREWETPLNDHYGEFEQVKGMDKDRLDVFLGPRATDTNLPVHVVDQVDPETGKPDEHKVILGARNEEEARKIYQRNYEKGWQGLGAITPLSPDEFKAWIKSDGPKKPLALPEAQQAEKADRKDEKPQKHAKTAGKSRSRQGFDPGRDTITQAVAKLGGIRRDDVGGDLSEGVMFQYDKRGRRRPVRAEGTDQPIVRATGGMTIDGMAENLSQYGYPVTDETGAFSRNALIEAINEEAAGRPVYSNQRSAESLDEQLEDERERHYGPEVEETAEQIETALWNSAMADLGEGETLTETQAKIRDIIPQAQEIDEGATEAALEAETDAEALRRLQEVIDGAEQVPEGREAVSQETEGREEEQAGEFALTPQEAPKPTEPARPAEEQGDMLAPATTGERVRQARTDREQEQKAAPPMDEGEGDLFSDKSKQQDVEDVAKKPAKPTRQQINTALRALADEKGYDSALISELHDRVGGDLDALKDTLRQGAQEGRYVLDVGDESLSSDQERAAAIDMDGTAYHRVRLAPKKKAKKKAAKKAEPEKKIEDFGEVLEGARKHYAQKLKDAESVDIASAPLSKSWPEPNYQQLLDEGIDPWTVAFIHAARDEVPRKPTKRFKLKRWVQQVEALRNTAENMLRNPDTARQAQESLREHPVLEPVKNRAELYQAVGHEQSLKGVSLTKATYSMYEGVDYGREGKTFWEINKAAKATAFGNMPRVIAKGDTKEEAIAEFKKAIESGNLDKPRSKNVRFDVYSRRNEPGTFYIGKKVGRDYVDLESFDSAKEAREYLKNNQDALEKKLAKLKEIPDHRKESNSPRVGVDHRNGADVTPEQFTETFNFRGVQFGNYVEGSRRQQDLNETYDALMDLAGILNLPAKALSLNGELGLAFGARGKGGKRAAKAHYERGNVVINLTKRRGAGSLAHEWWHSLDNYFSRMRGDREGFLTETPDGEGVRPEMVEAFREVTQAINRTRLKQRSRQLDKTRTKPYWSTGREMSARSFESYVIERLRDQEGANDYLANIVSEDYWNAAAALGVEKEGTYPYPEAAEIPEIRAAFDNFFQTVETRETDQGVSLFSEPIISGATIIVPEPISEGRVKDNVLVRKSTRERYKAQLSKSGKLKGFQIATKHGEGIDLEFIADQSDRTQREYLSALERIEKFGVPQRVLDMQDGYMIAKQRGFENGYYTINDQGISVVSISEHLVSQWPDVHDTARAHVYEVLVHEIGHVMDFNKQQDPYSAGSPRFAFPETAIERKTAKDGSVSTEINTEQTGDIVTELIDVYANDKQGLGDFFGYPFAKIKQISRASKDERAEILRLIPIESFAQSVSLFYNHPKRLKKAAPITYDFIQEVHNAYSETLTDGQRHRRIREAFQHQRPGTDVPGPGTTTQRSEGVPGEGQARPADGADASFGRDSGQVTETRETDQGEGMFSIAYHGSPHRFDRFDISRIGTGEGSQVYGHGIYLAENPETGRYYQDTLSKGDADLTAEAVAWDPNIERFVEGQGSIDDIVEGFDEREARVYRTMLADQRVVSAIRTWLASEKTDQDYQALDESLQAAQLGNLYTVDIPDSAIDKMMDWDKPLRDQPKNVRDALESLGVKTNKVTPAGNMLRSMEGMPEAFLGRKGATKADVSQALKEAGIPGIKYLDQGSRAQGEGTRNFVIFDDSLITILERNGEPVTGAEREQALASMRGESTGGMSTEAAREVVAGAIGKQALSRLEKSGRFTFVPTPADMNILESDRRRIFGRGMPSGTPGGLYDPVTGRSWIFTDNVRPDTIAGTFYHEVGAHYGLPRMIGKGQYNLVKKQLQNLANKGDERVLRAIARVPKETAKQHQWDEVLAYLMENNHEYVDMLDTRRQPDGLTDPLVRMLRRVIARIKAFLNEIGVVGVDKLGVDDIVELVRGAAVHAAKTAPKRPIQTRPGVYDKVAKGLTPKGTAQSYAKQVRQMVRDGQITQAQADRIIPWLNQHKRTPSPSERLDETVLDIPAKRSKTIRRDDVLAFLSSQGLMSQENRRKQRLRDMGMDFDNLPGDEQGNPTRPTEPVDEEPEAVDTGTARTNLQEQGFEAPEDEGMFSIAQEETVDRGTVATLLSGQEVVTTHPATKQINKLKKYAKRYFTKEGLLTDEAFDRHIQSMGLKNDADVMTQFMVDGFVKQVKKTYGKAWSKVPDEAKAHMNEYLAGNNQADVPAAVKAELDNMRTSLDMQSGQLQDMLIDEVKYRLQALSPEKRQRAMEMIQEGGTEDTFWEELEAIDAITARKVAMYHTIENNKRQYLNRSYRVFDDAGWKDDVDQAVVDRAKAYLREEVDNDPKLGQMSEQGKSDYVDGVINKILNPKGRDLMSFMSSQQLGQKDLSILKKRKEIAPEIRDLMGEYKDPRVNYARSMTKMAYLVANHHFLRSVREDGLGVFISARPSGRMSEEIAPWEDRTMFPLAGLHTTPEFAAALREAIEPKVVDGWLRSYLIANTGVKYGKTVLSPTTMARNFYSAALFTVMNGHFNWSHVVKAGSHTWADLGSSNPRKMGYLRKLVKLGVLHDNPKAQELREALDEAVNMDTLEGSMPARTMKTVLNGATKMYRAGDDFWKIIGFENEKADLMRNGVAEAEAEAMAAQRVRNGYPTYSMVPKVIRALRRFPVVGTFVSFPWEIMRTTSHQFRMMNEDRKAGRMGMAAKRGTGMAIAGGLAYGISQATMAIFGLSDDDDEAFRRMGPEWQMNAMLAYLGYDEEGHMRYLDLSHLDPYTYLKIPFIAFANGNYETVDEKAVAAMTEFLEPFLGTEIGFGALLDVWTNSTEFGPVYDENADIVTQGQQAFDHLRKELQPGVVSNIERTLKAWRDEYASYGRKYSKGDEALAWVGFRMTTMDPGIALRFRSFEFNDQISSASQPTYRKIRDPNIGAYEEIPEAVRESKGRWRESFRDMQAAIRAAEKVGMERKDIVDALLWGGVSKKNIGPLLSGKIPPWMPHRPTLNKAKLSIMRTRKDPEERRELAQEFSKRIEVLRQELSQ